MDLRVCFCASAMCPCKPAMALRKHAYILNTTRKVCMFLTTDSFLSRTFCLKKLQDWLEDLEPFIILNNHGYWPRVHCSNSLS